MCLQVTRDHNFKVFVFNTLFSSVEAYDQWFHISFYQKALDHDTQKRKPRPDENFSTTKCTARVNCRARKNRTCAAHAHSETSEKMNEYNRQAV